MERARELLSTTDLTVGQVSDAIGFTNDGYFYKAFKRQHGITPAEYRHSALHARQGRGA
jgi:two-component system response regulator YesN